jgi:ketosteroid isomerase-like protein
MGRCKGTIMALVLTVAPFVAAQAKEGDIQELRELISRYALSIEKADASMAEDVWSHAPEVTFIHTRGEEHGLEQILSEIYRQLMGSTFSDRKLTPQEVQIHVYGDTAWSEFEWNFVAKLRKDGTPYHSRGRETQVYHRERGKWRIVHVHDSRVPDAAVPKGL